MKAEASTMSSHHRPHPPQAPSAADAPAATVRSAAPRVVCSQSLFDGASELQIEHRGTLYRLRQTAMGKLILTK